MRNFEAGCKKAVVEMQGVERASKTVNRDLKRLMEDFSGQKIAVEATRVAEAVKRIGGANKLTDAEQRRVNATVTEAIEKYKRLGQEAPASLVKLAQETRKASSESHGLGASVLKLSSSFALANLATRAVEALAGAVVDLAKSAMKSAVDESVKMTSAMVGLRSVATAFGQDADRARVAAKNLAADGLMPVSAAAAGLKNLLATRFSLDESIALMNAFKDSAAFGRQAALSFGDAITGATEGIKNQNSTLVDNAGVTKNLSIILKEAGFKAEDLGRVTTDASVRMALYNGLIKETSAFTGDATRLTQTYTGQLSRMETAYKMLLATWGAAITENQTVAEAMRQVGDALVSANGESVKAGRAFTIVSDAVIGLVRAGAEMLSWVDYAQTGLNALIFVAAELGAGVVNLAGIFVSATRALIEWTRWSNPLTYKQQGKAIEQLDGVLGSLESRYNALAEISNAALSRSVSFGNTLTTQAARLRDVAKELEKTRGKTIEYGATAGRVAESVSKGDEKTGKAAEKRANEVRQAMDAITKDIFAMDGVLERAQDKEDQYWKAWAEDAREARAIVEAQVAGIDNAITGLVNRKWDQMDAISQMALFQNFTTDESEGFGKQTKRDTEQILQNIIDMATAAYEFGRALQRASQESSMMNRQLSGAKAGAQAGSMFGPWGTLIGGFVGLVAGGLLGDPKHVKVMRQVGMQWGLRISEGMAKQLEEDAKKLSGRVDLAAIMNLGNIIADQGGLTAENFSNNWLLAMDALRQYSKGALTATQVTKVLNETFADFVRAGSDSAGRLNNQMLELIKYVQEAGLEIQAVTEYLQEQARAAASGVNAIVNASAKQFDAYQKIADSIAEARAEIDELNKVEARGRGVEWAQKMADAQKRLAEALAAQKGAAAGAGAELENLGMIAVAAYNAAIASGMTHTQALQAAGPALLQLITAYENLGLSTDNAAVKALMMQAALLKNNPELLAGIDGLAQAMLAMANMGVLNEETFKEMQAAGQRMWERLSAEVEKNGGSTRDALIPMQAYLREAAEQARRLGIPLDENTQKLIDQSKELGIWKDKSEDPMETMISLMGEMRDAVLEMVDALHGIPPRVTTEVETRYTQRGTPPGGGGGGSAPGDGPTPTNVADPGRFGGGATQSTFTAKVYIDGREAAVAVAPHMADANRRMGV